MRYWHESRLIMAWLQFRNSVCAYNFSPGCTYSSSIRACRQSWWKYGADCFCRPQHCFPAVLISHRLHWSKFMVHATHLCAVPPLDDGFVRYSLHPRLIASPPLFFVMSVVTVHQVSWYSLPIFTSPASSWSFFRVGIFPRLKNWYATCSHLRNSDLFSLRW
jgi:hypothetical protein